MSEYKVAYRKRSAEGTKALHVKAHASVFRTLATIRQLVTKRGGAEPSWAIAIEIAFGLLLLKVIEDPEYVACQIARLSGPRTVEALEKRVEELEDEVRQLREIM